MIRWLLLAALLLLILRIWPRAFVFILTGAAVVGTGLFVWTRHIDSERARVTVSVAYDPSECPADKPLRVTVRNASPASLERMAFSIHAKRPGYSNAVTPYTYKQYESYKILASGETFSACYAKPLMDPERKGEAGNPADLEWSASVDSVHFR